MNEQKQIKALAKIDGYDYADEGCVWVEDGNERYKEPAPDYLHHEQGYVHMHRILPKLSVNQQAEYWQGLQVICERDSTDIWLASVIQMTESILQACGAWED